MNNCPLQRYGYSRCAENRICTVDEDSKEIEIRLWRYINCVLLCDLVIWKGKIRVAGAQKAQVVEQGYGELRFCATGERRRWSLRGW